MHHYKESIKISTIIFTLSQKVILTFVKLAMTENFSQLQNNFHIRFLPTNMRHFKTATRIRFFISFCTCSFSYWQKLLIVIFLKIAFQTIFSLLDWCIERMCWRSTLAQRMYSHHITSIFGRILIFFITKSPQSSQTGLFDDLNPRPHPSLHRITY